MTSIPIIVPRISRAILDLIASAYTSLPQAQSDRSSIATSHRIRIVNYIEAHLGDPDLTPMRVAKGCKMTARYLHHLFSEESETVARYILRRRLEECSRTLPPSYPASANPDIDSVRLRLQQPNTLRSRLPRPVWSDTARVSAAA